MQSVLVNAGKETQSLAMEMRLHVVERDLPTFLSPSSKQTLFLLGLQKTLDESLGGGYPLATTTLLYLFVSKSKNHLFNVSLLPKVSAVNPSVSTYLSSPLLTYQLCDPGACN